MRNIILIGMPGSGKTSLAKLLSRNLDLEYIDTDEQIEKTNHKSISQIFAENGEKYFRELERNVIKKIKPNQNLIISTGGGTPIYKNNSPILKNLGFVVYLFCQPKTIYQHLTSDSNQNIRPLIKPNLSEIKILYYRRNSIYDSCCHFVLNCDGTDLDRLSNKLFSVCSCFLAR